MFREVVISACFSLCIGSAALAAPMAMIPIATANAFDAETPSPALILEPLTPAMPETALFTLEETAVPFLGVTEEATTKVMIAIASDEYNDLFTIHFPRGTAQLTLAAEDMIALAAEAMYGIEGAEIWVASDPALNKELSLQRTVAVYEILRRNHVARHVIRIDDGSLEAILERPESLSHDIEA